jgi:hypothetical protein
MATELRDVHPSVYLLSDHLDSALAACEDLLTEQVAIAQAGSATTVAAVIRGNADLREFLDSVRRLEISITARIIEARKRAEDLRKGETDLRPFLSLFAGGTAVLLDAVAEFGEDPEQDFRTGNSALTYLKSRAILPADATSLDGREHLLIGEDFLLVHRIRLGTLMDLLAAFLDALELHYELFADALDDDAAEHQAASAAKAAALAAAVEAMRASG